MKQINLQNNLRKKFLKKGVKMIAPDTVFFSIDTKIGRNVSIEPYVVIGKKVKINNNVTIHSFSHLEEGEWWREDCYYCRKSLWVSYWMPMKQYK